MDVLRRQMKKALKFFGEIYFTEDDKIKKSSAYEWVADNRLMLVSAIRDMIKIDTKTFNELTPLFYRLEYLLKDGVLPENNTFVNMLKSEHLTLTECENLPTVLFSVFSVIACEGLQKFCKQTDTLSENTVIECVKSMNRLKDIDFEKNLPEISVSERLLCSDPAGIYPDMSNETKAVYRKAVCSESRRLSVSESDYIRDKLKKCEKDNNAHIGLYLDLPQRNKNAAVLFYVCEAVLSVFLSLLFSFMARGNICQTIVSCLLLFLPVFSVIKPLSDRISARLFRVSPLFSMNPCEEINNENGVIITVSSFLPEARKAEALYSQMSDLYCSNRSKNIRVLMLFDLKPYKEMTSPSDEKDVIAAKRVIDRLNSDFGGGFVIAIRNRTYSPGEKEYTGFERKRGAIIALVKFLRYEDNGDFLCVYGDTAGIHNAKYLMALDSDTSLSFDVLKKLTAIARHPMNEPHINPVKKRVERGYGVFVPRIETELSENRKTLFSSVFTYGGSCAYASAVSERYMDMFGVSPFTGKGLINIDAFFESCCDTFENGHILSHDILEGALLRCAFAGECELTDSFPTKPASFFSRQSRWIRGDIQNLKYIFKPLNEAYPPLVLPLLSKYQLLDNFRRGITPVFALLCFIVSGFVAYRLRLLLLLTGALSFCADGIFSAFFALISGGFFNMSRLFFSFDISLCVKNLLRAFLSLGLGVQTAFVNLDAIIRAAYRSLFSKKKLMQWTTAAQSDSMKNKNLLFPLALPLAVSIFLFLFSGSIGRLIAFVTLICIPFSLSDGIEVKRKRNVELSETEKGNLNCFAGAIWRFFEEYVTESESFLPPDNVQETPVKKIAHRTSPTNIGLYLVSCLAAADFSFITSGQLFERLSQTLSTIEKLEKYNGNLYNWYNTEDMSVLSPKYVSTVDCGNFMCSLLSLKQGLYEFAKNDLRFSQLTQRIQKLLDKCDLSPMYDKKRGLFHIGFDADTNTLTPSFYDLYISEARMTSFFNVAKRRVPVKHWQSLDRTLARSGRYAGAVSWTGTMFEYFMSTLFLPVYENSFEYEALKFCLHEQRKRVAGTKIPYGISESGFYSFDNSLNYRYKAHGIKSTAMKRRADDELVISPYSTFLTLPFETKSALKNLDRLSALHAEGHCGFYEAVDFSKNRTDGEDYCIVRSFMSHHLGMSMVALANTVFSDIFVHRFSSDPDIKSALGLLKEKIPVDSRIVNRVSENDENKRPQRNNTENTFFGEENRRVCMLSNSEASFICDEKGCNYFLFASRSIYNFSDRSKGISFEVNEDGERICSNIFSSARLDKNCLCVTEEKNLLEAKGVFCLHSGVNALLCRVKLHNKADKKRKINALFYMEPQLRQLELVNSHPAFSDMFIKMHYDKMHKALIFERPASGESDSTCVCIGFYSDISFSFETDREKVLKRNPYMTSPFESGFSDFSNSVSGVSPCAALNVNVPFDGKREKELVLILAVGINKKQALENLIRVRRNPLPDVKKCSTDVLQKDMDVHSFAQGLILRRYFSFPLSNERLHSLQKNTSSVEKLWQNGISGDLPIICINEAPNNFVRPFVRLHIRLTLSGIKNDLVILTNAVSDYNGVSPYIIDILKQEDIADTQGISGGVHIFSVNSIGEEAVNSIKCFSDLIFPDDTDEGLIPPDGKQEISVSEKTGNEENCFIENGYHIGKTQSRPWCHTLSNRNFGTLLSDKSLGFSWCFNSRQNKLTEWSNDIFTDLGGEKLYLKVSDKLYDCICNSTVDFCDSYALYESKCEDIAVKTKIEVPEKGMVKKISVSLHNNSKKTQKIMLCYSVSPLLSSDKKDAVFVKKRADENAVFAYNPINRDFGGFMCIASPDSECRYMLEEENCNALTEINLSPLETREEIFFMSFAVSEKAAKRLCEIPFREKKPVRIKLKSDNVLLNKFASALLLHQVYDTRLNARCGFYQCSGAYGFRDQLQDVLALIDYYPHRVRYQIFRSCTAQFPQGDVLHWYHIVYKTKLIFKGVRSRYSDDLLWLPFVVSEYVQKTDDKNILSVELPFVHGEELKTTEKERYGEFSLGEEKASVYEHCLRAIKKSLNFGEHSLPLMGGGDWNDSFNEVGIKGRGESVWLAMFLRMVLLKFLPICQIFNDKENIKLFTDTAGKLSESVDKYAYNGSWYVRAFADDGTVLGDKDSDACKIDLLPQAFSVLSSMPDEKRKASALESAYNYLVDEENGIVKLFTPAFNGKTFRAGYVNDYPEGVRENGGQYTHSAVWFALSLFEAGKTELAKTVLSLINPAEKYVLPIGEKMYKTEPYALCGDVYSREDIAGKGGWSLYTGSAGWFLQTVTKFLPFEVDTEK